MVEVPKDMVAGQTAATASLVQGARAEAAAATLVTAGGVVAALWVIPFRTPVAASVGLGVFALVALALLVRMGDYPHRRFGAANLVTLARAGGVAVFAGLAWEPWRVMELGPWLVFGAALGLLALDGVDGWLARRQDLESEFGARFDMEVDAVFILVLAVLALGLGKAGPWVLGLGLMRYSFIAAGRVVPWLRAPLFPSLRRKAVCVFQIVALGLLLLPLVQPPLSQAIAAAGFAALLASFAVDVAWLYCRRSR